MQAIHSREAGLSIGERTATRVVRTWIRAPGWFWLFIARAALVTLIDIPAERLVAAGAILVFGVGGGVLASAKQPFGIVL